MVTVFTKTQDVSCIKIDDNNCEGSECRLSVGVLAAIICGAVIIPLSCLVAVAGCVVKLRLQKLKKSENILSHTSTEAGTLPLRYTTNTSEDDCFQTKFLFVATFDLRPDPSPVQQLQEELRTKNMLIPKSQLRLGRVVGQASPQERPKFATLVNTLTDLLDSDSNYIKLLG
ncbi:hypothetical protein GBAR_LOCUS12830 [Geodia barretti]|uniref:Uncharacterized protein n=1 Tax=Geodia barretti TaxID=519541 RepID=A0AA35WII7_GEOBA|nr:hypothetical protein GBAR_LOCUS12830 [Geodia barretti]